MNVRGRSGSADLPLGSLDATGTSGTKGRGGRKKPVRPKEEKRLTTEWDSSGQEYVKDANHPDRPKRRTFALTALGHLGQ
ncbi:hypothetical protein KI387_004367, partial [Taxus chinensis]